jgi:hypothetical protein
VAESWEIFYSPFLKGEVSIYRGEGFKLLCPDGHFPLKGANKRSTYFFPSFSLFLKRGDHVVVGDLKNPQSLRASSFKKEQKNGFFIAS